MIIPKLENNNKLEYLFIYSSNIFNKLAGSNLYSIREINLPVWNMQSIATKTYSIGTDIGFKDMLPLGWKNIMSVSTVIVGDDGVNYINNSGIYYTVDSNNFSLIRKASDTFDNSNFSLTTISRGKLILWISK
jgi:hypothetical protein